MQYDFFVLSQELATSLTQSLDNSRSPLKSLHSPSVDGVSGVGRNTSARGARFANVCTNLASCNVPVQGAPDAVGPSQISVRPLRYPSL